MDVSSVMVDLSGKPKCEIICPFENCVHVSKLSTTRQTELSAAPKFNTFNFERHFQTQHVNKKRKPFDNITNHLDETPAKLINLKGPAEPAMASTSLQNSDGDSYVKNMEDKMLKQQKTICQLEIENIVLRHKLMDIRGKIRAFCRIKPNMGTNCFQWERNEDGTILKLDSNDQFALDYIFAPSAKNTDVFDYCKPLITSAADGFNVSIIAYGASGTVIILFEMCLEI